METKQNEEMDFNNAPAVSLLERLVSLMEKNEMSELEQQVQFRKVDLAKNLHYAILEMKAEQVKTNEELKAIKYILSKHFEVNE